jgi:hypothetical protein
MTAGGRRAVRTAIAAMALSFVSPAVADFQTGLTAYQRSDYAAALREWLPVADAGNPTAQLYLGLMYERGHGVPVNLAEARRWYERAAAASRDEEERRRAAAGAERVARAIAAAPVDGALLGKWRTTAPDSAGSVVEMLWDIAPSGDFAMSVSRRRPDGTVLGRSQERGQFKAKDGRWSYTLPSQQLEGTYRVVGADAFEATGPLGTARWVRVGAPDAPARPPTATPAPTPDARVLMEDDFRRPGRWSEMTGRYCRARYGDGGYVVDNVAVEGGACFLHAFAQPAAVRIEASLRLRSGPDGGGYGLGFGFDAGDGRYGTLAISPSGHVRLDGPDGTLLIPWTRDGAVRTGVGSTNELAVEIRGDAVAAFVNGKRIGAGRASRALGGELGFFVGKPGMSAVVTALRVVALGSAPAPLAPRSVYESDLRAPGVLPVAPGCRTAAQDGGLAVEAAGDSCLLPMLGAPSHEGDGRFELTIDVRRGAAAGEDKDIYSLVFGLSPDGASYYALQVGTRGFARLVRRDGELRELVPWTKDDAIQRGLGAVNRLAVKIEGRAVHAFVNGKAIAVAQVARPVSGRFGVLLNAAGMRVVVSQFRITGS